MTPPVTTAIVVSYYTGPRLKECLYALASDPAVTAIHIVDNGNPESMRRWLHGFADARQGVKLIDAGGNIGFGPGVNLGAEGAADGHLLIINPDAVLKRGSVEAMAEAMAGARHITKYFGFADKAGKECQLAYHNAAMAALCAFNPDTEAFNALPKLMVFLLYKLF